MGGHYIRIGSIIYTPHQILFRWSNQSRWGG